MSEKIYPVGFSFNTNRYANSDFIKPSCKKVMNKAGFADISAKLNDAPVLSARNKLRNILKIIKFV